MADIVKKSGTEAAEWSPFRTMRELMRWDPFREMTPFAGWPFREDATGWSPRFDVTENEDGYVFKADVPGVKKEDLEITANGNRLTVFGKRDTEHETKTDTVYTYERESGSFTRAFTLPDGADVTHATSDLNEGVLTLVIPKTKEAQAKKIPISTAATKS